MDCLDFEQRETDVLSRVFRQSKTVYCNKRLCSKYEHFVAQNLGSSLSFRFDMAKYFLRNTLLFYPQHIQLLHACCTKKNISCNRRLIKIFKKSCCLFTKTTVLNIVSFQFQCWLVIQIFFVIRCVIWNGIRAILAFTKLRAPKPSLSTGTSLRRTAFLAATVYKFQKLIWCGVAGHPVDC